MAVPVKKIITGSHSGTGWWLAQRISAVVLLLAGASLFAAFVLGATFDYTAWRAAFQNQLIQLLVWMMVASLCLHAWIGLRDVLMDYVKPTALRLVLNVLIILMLSMSVVWVTVILWGSHG